ncbi:MAG: enoyl-CoA hydratase/isomerase family protein [Promethearchaeota archaeon]
MKDEFITVEKIGRLMLIKFNRPERANSLTPEILDAFKKTLLDAQHDHKVRVLIITGTGRDFTTGMDVSIAKEYTPGERKGISAAMERLGAETASIIYHGKPTICAINGRTMGMGMVYALASDFRFSVDDATFKMPEVDSSIYPAANCITLMVLNLGIAKTKEILMTCRTYSAIELKNAGLINEIYSKDIFMEKVIDFAKNLSRKNQDILRFLKININHVNFMENFQESSLLEKFSFDASFKKDKGEWLEEMVKKFGLNALVKHQYEKDLDR